MTAGGTSKSFGYSLLIHAAFACALYAYLTLTPPHARGGSGLIGAGRTKLTLVMNVANAAPKAEAIPKQKLEKLLTQLKAEVVIPVKAPPKKIEKEVKLAKQLPTEVKNKNTKIIEDKIMPTQAAAERAENGNDPDAESASVLGQGGTSDTPAEALGDGDDSNELGEYLATVKNSIQRELESPGSLIQSKVTQLKMKISESGVVQDLQVHVSSGEKRLDLLAIDAVKRAQPFQPHHKPLPIIIVPVKFNVATK